MLVRNIQPGTMYRVNLPGGITRVYRTPSLNDPFIGKTLPDMAVIKASNVAKIGSETWLQFEYKPSIPMGYIPLKDGAVKLQTMEMPIFVDDTPTKPLPNAPQSPPALEPGLNPVVLPETHQNGSNAQNNAIVAQLKVIAGAINALITLLENEPIKV